MDIFDVLAAIAKRKITFMRSGINEYEAWIKAQLDISKEYHIPLPDIERLAGQKFTRSDIYRHRRLIS